MIASKRFWLLAATVAGLVSGCGGGGGAANTASSLSGVAAVGSPIAGGTIAIKCAGGSAPASTVTDAVGGWQVTLSGQTLPCAVQVSGGTVNSVANANTYLSIANALGDVNVTPLTDLVVANLAGAAVPGSWFAGLNAAAFGAVTVNAVNAALAQLAAGLGPAALDGFNPLTFVFQPTGGDPMDDILSALQVAITNSGSSLAALRAAAAGSTFTPPAGFGAALAAAYGATSSGAGGNAGGGGNTPAGSLVVTSVGGSARNGTFTPDATALPPSLGTTLVFGITADGNFEYQVSYASNGTILNAALWYFSPNNVITFFGCNNTAVPCGNLVGFEPLTRQIRFNNALLAQVADPLVSALVPNGEQIQVNGQITVP